MKYLKTYILICVVGLLFASCIKKENYPDYPIITFNSFTVFGLSPANDSAYLRVNFTDGNGQIGYPQQQEGAPPNFFIQPLVYNQNTNTYDTIVQGTADTALSFRYLVPYITPSGSDKELSGIIQINLEGPILTDIDSLSPLLSKGIIWYQVEFKVWMYDRNGNKSNVLTTPPQYLNH